MGKFPDPKLRIESSFHFPEVGSSNQGLARCVNIQLKVLIVRENLVTRIFSYYIFI